MASPGGGPNTSAIYDTQALFKPPSPSPGAIPRQPFPPTSAYPSPLPPSTFPTPTHPGAFSYPMATPPFHHHPFLHYPQESLHRLPVIYPPVHPHLPNPNPNTNPSTSSNTNPGARLMALLNPPASPQLDPAVSMPPPSSTPSDFLMPSTVGVLHPMPSAPHAALAQPAPTRLPSNKSPRGRLLSTGAHAVYDVDSRLPGENQPPQLEVTPITKYISDPGLVLGRQIAVNRTYICYGLKLGAVRVLNINTALRSLLKGHSQRVTDMAFFAEDVHLLASASIDGRIFVWKIDEGPDEDNKPLITGKIIMAIQIVGDKESYHPRICWHSHKQEIMFVGIGVYVLKIDINKVGRGKEFLAEEPLKCPIEKIIEGVQIIGKHDGEVTDLSISQWMVTRLASSSKDGTVKIWDDRKAMPLSVLRPHDGHPVNSVEFMTAPNHPEHINLITAGPLSRELKFWASSSEEGWLLPSDSESWHCSQTLDLRSSSEPQTEEAFFNQLVVLPQASLIIIANAKKNAIYAVHIDYGLCPASTRMDHIADFTVAMPILSLTVTHDILLEGDIIVQVYCVQTQAIQQYALDLIQCLPPPIANVGLAKDPSSHVTETSSSEGLPVPAISSEHYRTDYAMENASLQTLLTDGGMDCASAAPALVIPDSSETTGINESSTSNADVKLIAPPLPDVDADAMHAASSPVPFNMDIAGRSLALKSPEKTSEDAPSYRGHETDQSVFGYSVEKDGRNTGHNDISPIFNPPMMLKLGGNSTHLITPSEILSGAISTSESSNVNKKLAEEMKDQDINTSDSIKHAEVEVKLVGEFKAVQPETNTQKVAQDFSVRDLSPQTSIAHSEVDNEAPIIVTSFEEESHSGDDIAMVESKRTLLATAEEDGRDSTINATEDITEPSVITVSQSLSVVKGKKQKGKQHQTSSPSSPSSTLLHSTYSLNESALSENAPLVDPASTDILAMQEMLSQVVNMQKELQKQMSVIVAAPVAKEGKRMETSLSRNIEKMIKANGDALWARVQEENAKYEKFDKERMQQITNLIANNVNKDLPTILERAVKKELSTIGSTVARSVAPAISSAIAESFQRGVGDKAVTQLEKSVSSKLEATVARQIQVQFQNSGKQILQDSLRSCLESSVVPAFEQSCKAMFEQVDNAFQKGMNEHAAAAHQQLEAANTPLAVTLREAISSASSITQSLTTELIDGQRKILALIAAGNTKVLNPLVSQQANGPTASPPEMASLSLLQVGAHLDPTKELSRLISEHKYEEAFTLALQRSDVSIVSWLCAQVDLHAICSTVPLPLSQGVLLALLQQLACDIGNETSRKVGWMTDVAVVINPADQMIVLHVRPIFEQVYSLLGRQRALPTTTAPESAIIRLLMHVINSVLTSCK
ncbi:hypothetical protein ZIOFF_023312 [Zingiber officinale]|uniref:Enhancer of mRNA-decapping protein 4 n=1 Tax=Zingiber officinale TaxID=94328 RepID=A0A8J5H6E9_ZINOF|nr:hypothetical protein ZIOFF_023312 [Zingiber officinale]